MNRDRFLAALSVLTGRQYDGAVWLCDLRDVLSNAGDTYPRKTIEEAFRAGWITLEVARPVDELALVNCSATQINWGVYHLAKAVRT